MVTKKNKYDQVSPQIQAEAMKIAKATQRPGQTKEQTKLISQGIEKGIHLYKKQQKSKSRELNKKLNKASQKESVITDSQSEFKSPSESVYKHSLLSWGLLVVSWILFAIFFYSK